jgi:hypothetical protein
MTEDVMLPPFREAAAKELEDFASKLLEEIKKYDIERDKEVRRGFIEAYGMVFDRIDELMPEWSDLWADSTSASLRRCSSSLERRSLSLPRISVRAAKPTIFELPIWGLPRLSRFGRLRMSRISSLSRIATTTSVLRTAGGSLRPIYSGSFESTRSSLT